MSRERAWCGESRAHTVSSRRTLARCVALSFAETVVATFLDALLYDSSMLVMEGILMMINVMMCGWAGPINVVYSWKISYEPSPNILPVSTALSTFRSALSDLRALQTRSATSSLAMVPHTLVLSVRAPLPVPASV